MWGHITHSNKLVGMAIGDRKVFGLVMFNDGIVDLWMSTQGFLPHNGSNVCEFPKGVIFMVKGFGVWFNA